jgi:hypothetical protein
MVIRIKPGECCGGICNLDDVEEGNFSDESKCCEGDDECCHEEWADD